MTTIREALLGEKADRRKLDMLVRQGMMSPAALPMLHRGLDKLQAGKTLNPMERDAVAKVVDSLMYIVTGDDTVFQKARQHTQKNKYQTEETEQLDEYGNYQVNIKGSGGTTVKARSDKEASQKAFKNMGIADRHRKTVSHSVTKMKEDEEYDNEGEMAKKQLTTLADAAQELMGMLSDNQNLPEWVQSKITKAVDYLDTARDYMKSEGDDGKAPVGEEIEEKMDMKKADMGDVIKDFQKSDAPQFKGKTKDKKREMAIAAKLSAEDTEMSEEDNSYKAKFAAMLKKTGKSLDQMSDEEKKKFFNSVDAAHKAKNEGAMSRMATQAAEKERLGANKVKGTGLETYKKKPVAPKPAKPVTENAQQAMRDAKRAARFDKKGMAPTKKPGQGSTKSYKGTGAGDEKHGGHIVMQMRKAVTINKPVKFKDGTTKPISKAHAHKFLSKYNAGKPAEKEAMHSAHDSHDAFMKHINK